MNRQKNSNNKNRIRKHTQTPNLTKPREPFSLHPILLFLSLSFLPVSNSALGTPPPLPILPIPSARQLQWQLSTMAMFFHFGPNTFTDSDEWGAGDADPNVFHPTLLNASQWVQVAKDFGFGRVILTAKHHDGFCLWASQYTNYSVMSSSWRNGTGDVVRDLSLAAQEAGVNLGIYLSPWDRHEPCFGQTLEYNEYYMGQMTELLTRYGEIKEVFLDGAKGEGEKDMEYFFDTWFTLIHQHQPMANIFSDAGPDSRWVGNENGTGGSTSWSPFNHSAVAIGGHNDRIYVQEGDPFGHDWLPPVCDVSIRPSWFWHPSESPMTPEELLDIYYSSVGRNCLLLLNVPPNSSGLISAEDIGVLQRFTKMRKSIFSYNLASNAILGASSTRGGIGSQFDPYNIFDDGIYTYWAPEEHQSSWELYLDLQEPVSFNVLKVQEPIHMGQRIATFHLEILSGNGVWRKVVDGTTVGYLRLIQFPEVESRYLKFVVDKARADPLISFLGIYMDRYPKVTISSDKSLRRNPNRSHILHQTTHNHTHLLQLKILEHARTASA